MNILLEDTQISVILHVQEFMALNISPNEIYEGSFKMDELVSQILDFSNREISVPNFVEYRYSIGHAVGGIYVPLYIFPKGNNMHPFNEGYIINTTPGKVKCEIKTDKAEIEYNADVALREYVVKFNTLDEVIKLAKVVPAKIIIDSSLYKNDGKYFLVFTCVDKNVNNIFSEYNAKPVFICSEIVKEYEEVILDDALSALALV